MQAGNNVEECDDGNQVQTDPVRVNQRIIRQIVVVMGMFEMALKTATMRIAMTEMTAATLAQTTNVAG